MRFAFRSENFNAILDHYHCHGFVLLTEVDQRIANAYRQMLAEVIGVSRGELEAAGAKGGLELTPDARARLARPQTTGDLQELMLSVLGNFLAMMLGPFVHISQTFHPQVKGRPRKHILSGYSGDGLEVEAPYGFHQDFTAGRITTSPSAVVCWIPLNDCDENCLRLYPGSHSLGFLTNRWLPYDVTGIDRIGPYVDIEARAGETLFFNFLLLHGTSRPGPTLRMSCDVRFFPFCGLLDSPVKVLRTEPVRWIGERLSTVSDDTLVAPLRETLAYLGQDLPWPALRPHSPLHWARFVEGCLRNDAGQKADAISHLANADVGFDPVADYLGRFTGLTLEAQPYRSALPHLSATDQRRCETLLAQISTAAG